MSKALVSIRGEFWVGLGLLRLCQKKFTPNPTSYKVLILHRLRGAQSIVLSPKTSEYFVSPNTKIIN